MTDIRIIGPGVSPFVTKVVAAADYKRLPYTHQDYVSIRALAKLNPVTKKVPFVRIGGETVIDSTLILRRFDQLQSNPRLFCEDVAIAAKQRLLEDWSDESLYWNVQALRWCAENEHRTIAQNTSFVPAPLRLFAKPLLRALVGRQPKAQGLGRLPYELLVSELGNRLNDLTLILGDRAFFHSNQPSAADFAIYGVFRTGCSENVTPDFAEQVAKRPALVEWQARVEQAIRRPEQS